MCRSDICDRTFGYLEFERGNGVLSFSAFAFYVNVDFFFHIRYIYYVDLAESYYLRNLNLQ